jgi:hypothetical protein
MSVILNLFYEEPNPDRWIKFDRYPRQLIRKLFRGKTRPGGVMMVALELIRGLDKLKIPYRFNDYKYAKKNPHELIGVIGKPHLIFRKKFKNPILFGAGIFSHPTDCPNLFTEYPNVKKILVPGQWMVNMFEPYYGNKVQAWPVGIDTYKWNEKIKNENPTTDFLIYDKILWQHDEFQKELISPIISELEKLGLCYEIIKYGSYTHAILFEKLARCKAVIFLCEHETQGLAYQQILATNTPILAFDKAGYWKDPAYYPKIKFQPVSSVPYWDNRCGLKFTDSEDFRKKLIEFQEGQKNNLFSPSSYISDNLTLEIAAQAYVDIYNEVKEEISQKTA